MSTKFTVNYSTYTEDGAELVTVSKEFNDFDAAEEFALSASKEYGKATIMGNSWLAVPLHYYKGFCLDD